MEYSDEPQTYFLPVESLEDQLQDIEVKRLLGLNTNRKPRASYNRRQLSYGCYVPEGLEPIAPVDDADYEVPEKLLQWMIDQTAKVQIAVMEYLINPDDRKFATILRLIDVAVEKENPKKPRATLAQLILRVLPASKSDLMVMARQQHQSERPEAAVRQILRRMIRDGVVKEEGELYVRV